MELTTIPCPNYRSATPPKRKASSALKETLPSPIRAICTKFPSTTTATIENNVPALTFHNCLASTRYVSFFPAFSLVFAAANTSLMPFSHFFFFTQKNRSFLWCINRSTGFHRSERRLAPNKCHVPSQNRRRYGSLRDLQSRDKNQYACISKKELRSSQTI